MSDLEAKRKQIKTGLSRLRLGERPNGGKNYPSFLSPDDITKILLFLSDENVVISMDNGADLTGCCIARIEALIDE